MKRLFTVEVLIFLISAVLFPYKLFNDIASSLIDIQKSNIVASKITQACMVLLRLIKITCYPIGQSIYPLR